MGKNDQPSFDDQIAGLANRQTDHLRLTLRTNEEILKKMPPAAPKRADTERFIAAIEAELAKR
jgi:hypothetical protein